MLHQEHAADGIRRVVLVAGRGNALGPKLLAEIERAFDPGSHPAGPVILAGRGRSFCTGLDLVSAWDYDRGRMRELMERFHRALRAVLLWPAPVVAEIQGHALAGGALLALCADRRVMARGDARFGIHGAQLGVVYPQVAIEIVRWKLPRPVAESVLYGGQLRSGPEALAQGLVDELADPGELAPCAAEFARELRFIPGMREALVHPVGQRLATIEPAGMEAWLDRWFDSGTRERVGAARQSLLSRTAPRPGESAPGGAQEAR